MLLSVIFGFKTDLSDQTPSPTCQTRCIFLVWRPLNYALMGGVWFRINNQSHTHEKRPFKLFFTGYFCSFSAIEQLYRTRLRAPHVEVNLFSLFEGNCINLRREGPRSGLSLTKKSLFQANFGSFSTLKQIYRTRPRAQHVNRDVSFSYEGLCIVLWWEESGFRLIFSLTLTKKGLFSHLVFWLFWLASLAHLRL